VLNPKAPPTREPGDILARMGKKALNPYDAKSHDVVGRTAEFKRIFNIPRRREWADVSAALTAAFAKQTKDNPLNCPVDCVCGGMGYMVLRPRQAWALAEAFEVGGAVGLLGPGEGKTLVSLLLPLLAGWQRPLILVPAGLRGKTVDVDIPLLAKHWKLPTNLDIRSYEEMSRVKFADYLEVQRIPDGIIADEVHNLKNRAAARTKRLLRYFQKFPETQFLVMSGSLVHRSLMDYGHLTLLALKDTAPLPHGFIELKTWADALDDNIPDAFRPKPGALLDFCEGSGGTARDGFRSRLLETKGVISSPDLSTTSGLIIREAPTPEIPAVIQEAFKGLRNGGVLPGGEVCTTALDQNRRAKELALGFYYKWEWPDDVPDVMWLEARKHWRMFVRQMTTRSHGGVYYDTELQVANGVRAGLLKDEVYDKRADRWRKEVYGTWTKIREERKKLWGKPEPPKKAVWLSDYMLLAVEKWMAETTEKLPGARGPGAIIWVESIGFLEKLRERGHPCFGAGQNDIMHEKGDRHVIASMAHSVGKNLQMFSRSYYTSPHSSGKANEQGIARIHRPGQSADDVIVDILLLCRESWWSFFNARQDARYIEQTLGQKQRLNQATVCVANEMEVCERFDRGDPLWTGTGFARMDDKASASGVNVVHADEDSEIDSAA
jgi:hypothetical protein